MTRASNAFSVLQATAAVVGLAILLWSVGLTPLRFAEAANVTTYSDTLSDSAPSVNANHTIRFTTPTGVTNAQSIVLSFDTAFDTTGVLFSDIDMATSSGEFTLAANCAGSELASAVFAGDVLTITMCETNSSIAANGTTTIEIGTNATHQTTGVNQIGNPTIGSYEIALTAGADSGTTEVAIVNTVNVTASVDTLFTFSVAGTASGTSVNGAHTTGGATTATTIPFGQIDAGVASTAAQLLTVTTNAKNGFVVTVQSDGQLDSSTGADIDGYINGSYTTTPTSWTAPSATIGQENTYGHWGLTSDDAALTSGYTDLYGTGLYVSASTTAVEVFRHSGPSNGSGMGVGTTTVGYRIQRSALQEAADDYQATLTYVATPVF